jgi:hypothetical protein
MNSEKSANKVFPQDAEKTGSETRKAEQQSTEIRGTSDVVQLKPVPPALNELSLYVYEQCTKLWNHIAKNRFLVYHPHRDVSRKIVRVVDEVCYNAVNEVSLLKCLIAFHTMASVLLGQTERGEALCPLVQRLIEDERKGVSEIRRELTNIVNATINRLDISPERVKEIEKKAIENIVNGKLYVDDVLEHVKSLAVWRLMPSDMVNIVNSAEIDEFKGKLTIHITLAKAGEPPDVSENVLSFTVVSDLIKVGDTYLADKDYEVWLTDLNRPEMPPPPPKEKGKSSNAIFGNVKVTVPAILKPAIERFLRMGWLPDGTTSEFLKAIQDKIVVIKTPEEMFADTLARVFYGVPWVIVNKTETGQYVLGADIPVSSDNPWQKYVFLVPADGEIWVPSPIWRKVMEMFEKVRIPRKMIEYIIKSKKISRSAKTCESGRTIEMHNLVALDVARVEEVLNDKIENYFVYKVQTCEGGSE